METVEHAHGVGGAFGGDLESGLPHVGADDLELLGALLAEPVEECLEGGDLAVLADPEQAEAALVELADEG